MSLRWKTALILILVLAVLLIIQQLVTAGIVRHGFQKAEERGARLQLDSLTRILAERLDKLATTTGDWAVWDDTYAFMQSGDPAFLDANVSLPAFQEINANLACFIDSSGRIAAYRGFDLAANREIPFPVGLAPYLNTASSPLLRRQDLRSRPAGIAVLPAGPILLAARRILTSQGQGPARGTLVIGRFLDPVEIARIAERVQTGLDIRPLADPRLPGNFSAAAAALGAGRSGCYVKQSNQNFLAAYTLLNDLSGKPALIARMTMPRNFQQSEQVTNTILFWQILLTGVLCFAVTLLLLERTVLRRLASLSGKVETIGNTGDCSALVALPGRDEVAGLSRSIDGMLAALQSTRQQLGENESRFRSLIENALDIIAVIDAEGIILYASPSAERVSGYRPHEVVGRPFVSLLHPEELETTRYNFSQLIHEPERINRRELRIRNADGAYHPFEVVACNRLNDPAVRGIVVNCRDISEKIQAQETLRQAFADLEQRVGERTAELFEINRRLQDEILERTRTGGELVRLRKAVERLPLGVTITDREGKILYTNPAEAAMRGCVVEDLIGDDGTVVSPRETARPETSVQMKTMGVWARERTCVRKDGSVFSAHLLSSTIMSDEGEPIGIVTSCEDITDRKKAEDEIRRLNAELEQRVTERTAQLEEVVFRLKTEIVARRDMECALRKSEESYRNLFNQIPVGLYCSTPSGEITDANPAMVKLLGYADRNDFLQVRALDVWSHPEDRRIWLDRVEREETITGEDVRWRRHDGSEIWVRWHVRATRDDDGGVISYTGAVEDITERKRIEEQLTRAQKMEMLGQFASGIAHDFNNLIMVISGTVELLQRQLPPGDRFHPDLGTILRTARRATELSRSLLAFARKQVLQRQDIDLTALVQDMLPMMQRIIPENITVQFRSGPAVVPVHADPGQIENALINLLMNARDAMPAGGAIDVTVGIEEIGASFMATRPWVKPGHYAFVTVRDTGAGMPEHVLAHIFEPFFTTKEPGHGTGLGLSTVYGIVKQHEGMVEVSSRPGDGTVFTLYLPKSEGRWELYHPSGEGAVKGGSEKILVVEDQPDLRGLVSRFLQELGYQVRQACNGQQALNMLQTDPDVFDLVLTDLVMPLMSGLELFRQVPSRTPATAFLFTSGYLEEATRCNLEQNPSVAFLAKPYDIGDLAVKVRSLLKNRGC